MKLSYYIHAFFDTHTPPKKKGLFSVRYMIASIFYFQLVIYSFLVYKDHTADLYMMGLTSKYLNLKVTFGGYRYITGNTIFLKTKKRITKGIL